MPDRPDQSEGRSPPPLPAPPDPTPPTQKAPLDYEPWPQRRRTPKPVKVLIWAALIIHSLGIFPALAFLWYALTDSGSQLSNVLWSGACCIPFGVLLLLSVLVVMSRMGEDGK